MKYQIGDKIVIKRQNNIYSKEFISLLEKHNYIFTISSILSEMDDIGEGVYEVKEMQEDDNSWFSFPGYYIKELYVYTHDFIPIYSRLEILDIR